MRAFPFEFFTAERTFFKGKCESLIVPTPQGAYGIMAGHSDLVLVVDAGELKYREKGKEGFVRVAVAPGLLAVKKGMVTVLVEAAEKDSDIDYERAQKQYEDAKIMFSEGDDHTRRLATAKMARALARLKVRSGLNK
ncbi:MAG: ATP synthase F1 subunit epsilon [Clostridia bacterium]|nr:ATP synthase F1 subunit epsilon [Clostridia bacterium]